MSHTDPINKLTNQETHHRKQEFLKSNILNQDNSVTHSNTPLVTAKTVFKDEKVIEINDSNTNTLVNKRQELNSHFCIGDDHKFEDYNKMPMTYEKNSWKKDNQEDKSDHMQSNIFHQQTTQKRDMNKVNEEKKKHKDIESKHAHFD